MLRLFDGEANHFLGSAVLLISFLFFLNPANAEGLYQDGESVKKNKESLHVRFEDGFIHTMEDGYAMQNNGHSNIHVNNAPGDHFHGTGDHYHGTVNNYHGSVHHYHGAVHNYNGPVDQRFAPKANVDVNVEGDFKFKMADNEPSDFDFHSYQSDEAGEHKKKRCSYFPRPEGWYDKKLEEKFGFSENEVAGMKDDELCIGPYEIYVVTEKLGVVNFPHRDQRDQLRNAVKYLVFKGVKEIPIPKDKQKPLPITNTDIVELLEASRVIDKNNLVWGNGEPVIKVCLDTEDSGRCIKNPYRQPLCKRGSETVQCSIVVRNLRGIDPSHFKLLLRKIKEGVKKEGYLYPTADLIALSNTFFVQKGGDLIEPIFDIYEAQGFGNEQSPEKRGFTLSNVNKILPFFGLDRRKQAARLIDKISKYKDNSCNKFERLYNEVATKKGNKEGLTASEVQARVEKGIYDIGKRVEISDIEDDYIYAGCW